MPRRRGRASQSLVDWVAGLIVSSGIATGFLLGADRAFRPDWDFTWQDHWIGSALLVGAVAAWLGLVWSLVVLVELAVTRPLRRRPDLRRWGRAVFHALLFGGLVWSTARWTFAGKRISQTVFGHIGPPLFVVAVMGIVAAFVWWVIGVERRCARGDHRRALLVGGGLIAASVAPVWLDMTLYVSLYEPLHGLLEALAFALIFTGTQLVGFVAVRRWGGLLWASRGLALCLLAHGTIFSLSPMLRERTDRLLGHTWVDEIYVGRALRRTQNLEATLQGTDPKSLEIVRVQRLVERYELGDTSLHPSWDEPPPPSSTAVQALRGAEPRNVLVFYIDTLRNDVARDPELMPAMVRFAEQSLDFRRAYAPGSDTLRTLPALTGGNYYVRHNHANDLCNIAERAPHESVLVTPRSAHEFLSRLRPAFAFEKVIEVRDYSEEKEVWGYGADRPTAPKLVDETLAYIQNRPRHEPFFLWMFNFDQHSWREMDEAYVEERAQTLGVPREGDLNWRYRVIARSIDAEFERLIAGLERLGALDDTVILVVADHGEGLGRAGFWVHSVFLWESLIRVPLILRVPGVEPQVIEDIVSLVDVAPTLAPFFGSTDRKGYQGVDLLAYAAGEHPQRQHPLVLRAASRDRLVRVGLLDPETGLKLVVRLEAALPELYDLDVEDPDGASLASQRPGMTRALLRRVATSPVFPRESRDFDLLVDLGTKEF